jgi:hypothetical protein
MKKSEKQIPVKLINGFRWVRIQDQIVILNSVLDEKWNICGVEADLWDWLVQGIPLFKIITMMALLCGIDESNAYTMVSKIMLKWKNANLIEEKTS